MNKILILALLLALNYSISAQYKLYSSVFGSGGTSTGGTYIIKGSVFQPNTGLPESETYSLKIGFWYTYLYKAYTIEPMPVELTSFTAGIVSSGVELKWQTATEVNNYGFDIERASLGTTPGQGGNTPLNPLSGGDERVVWEKIGFVEGHGNSNSPKGYSFIDANPIPGFVQYRLKQIDLDGNYKYYSQLAEVNFSLTDEKESRLAVPVEFELSQNFPNPFNPSTLIKYAIPQNSHITIEVYSMLGEKITTLVNKNVSAGYHEVSFDAKKLNSGIYIYRLTANSLEDGRQFTKSAKMMLIK